jgi:hypothetical protein
MYVNPARPANSAELQVAIAVLVLATGRVEPDLEQLSLQRERGSCGAAWRAAWYFITRRHRHGRYLTDLREPNSLLARCFPGTSTGCSWTAVDAPGRVGIASLCDTQN